jgi:hypothetical protein
MSSRSRKPSSASSSSAEMDEGRGCIFAASRDAQMFIAAFEDIFTRAHDRKVAHRGSSKRTVMGRTDRVISPAIWSTISTPTACTPQPKCLRVGACVEGSRVVRDQVRETSRSRILEATPSAATSPPSESHMRADRSAVGHPSKAGRQGMIVQSFGSITLVIDQ